MSSVRAKQLNSGSILSESNPVMKQNSWSFGMCTLMIEIAPAKVQPVSITDGESQRSPKNWLDALDAERHD
jgi:hypothetical protein